MHYNVEKYFEQIKFAENQKLYPKNWNQLSIKQKVSALQELSDKICDFEKRPRYKIGIYDFKNRGLDYLLQ